MVRRRICVHAGSELIVSVAEPQVEIAQQRNQHLPNVSVQVGNAEALSLADASADRLISNFCLQLVSDPDRMLREGFRVLVSHKIAFRYLSLFVSLV